MYTSLRSAKLTLIITWCFCAMLLLMMILAKPFLLWFFGYVRIATIKTVLYAFYTCCPAAWVALICILKLLYNILKEDIFIMKNVTYMRVLSWCCAFVSAACLFFGIRYIPLLIFSMGAAFMMLILRVLKSIMARATEIKNENELTI